MPITAQIDTSLYDKYTQTPEQQALQQSLIEQRRASIQQRREQIEAAREKAREQQQYHAAIQRRTDPQTGQIDFDGLETDLYGINQKAGTDFTEARDKSALSKLQQYNTRAEAAAKQGELAANYARAAKQSPQALATVLSQMPPDLAVHFPQDLNAPGARETLDAIEEAGLRPADSLAKIREKSEALVRASQTQKNELDMTRQVAGLASVLSPEDLPDFWRNAPILRGVSRNIVDYLSKLNPDKLRLESMTTEEQNAQANRLTTSAREGAQLTETQRHNRELEDAARQLRDIARQRLAKELKDSAADVGDVKSEVRTTLSGRQYVDLGDWETPKARQAVRDAARRSGLVVIDKQTGDSLRAADQAKLNLNRMWAQIEGKLPKDATGRLLVGPENKLSKYFQTSDELAAFNSWRAAAIQTVQALAERGMGLRITQGEIQTIMDNDLPQLTDTYGTALQRVRNALSMLKNKEDVALTHDRSTLGQDQQPMPGGTPAPAGSPQPSSSSSLPAGSKQVGKYIVREK